jgi:electron transport complex protein RnfC
MNIFGAKTFAHGIHPPDSKTETSREPIRQFPFAPMFFVPLSQHIGKPAVAVVREGQEVTRGQCIAEPDGFLSVAMHSPATGIIKRIGLIPSINGKMVPGLFIEPYPASTQEVLHGTPCDVESSSPEEIINAIQNAGVVGLGGAGFPSHAKLRIPEDKQVDTILINGAECEPYLTTDHRVMVEHAADVISGIRYLLRASGATRAIIAIETNKADAAESMRAVIPSDQPIRVEVLPVKYPQGAEKMLTTALLGREVPSGGLPVDVGALCLNVGSIAEIGRLLPVGAGLQERVITVGGPAVRDKGNYRVPIGTPIRFVLETVGVDDDVTCVFLGGPMMGQAVSSFDIPITKGTTGIIAFTRRETGYLSQRKQYPCIRCGYCVEACPIFLNPSQLGLLAEQRQYKKMADEFHLMDCFECGCCTFVCPSHIPLVQQFRVSKAAVRKERQKG